MHKGELPAPAALRELKEETGLVCTEDQLESLGQAVHRSHGLVFTMHVFRVSKLAGELRLQRIEISDAAWVRPNDLSLRNAHADVLEAVGMLQ